MGNLAFREYPAVSIKHLKALLDMIIRDVLGIISLLFPFTFILCMLTSDSIRLEYIVIIVRYNLPVPLFILAYLGLKEAAFIKN